jgi:hypothetical protein
MTGFGLVAVRQPRVRDREAAAVSSDSKVPKRAEVKIPSCKG